MSTLAISELSLELPVPEILFFLAPHSGVIWGDAGGDVATRKDQLAPPPKAALRAGIVKFHALRTRNC